MQTNRTADRPALAGSVRGLGLSDALRVELQPVQVPWLIDALDALCGARPVDQGDGRDRDEREYELRLIRIMRAGLAVGADVSPIPFIGPSGMVATAVRSAMRSAMDALRELVRQDPIDDDGVERLQETADAVAAWVRSYVDCRAVVWFNVDPDAEPGANW
jgi:hypothetical protein